MLRQKKNNNGTSKRNSMFLDSFFLGDHSKTNTDVHSSRSKHTSSIQTKNISQPTLKSSSRIKPLMSTPLRNGDSKDMGRGRLQRSSMVLDNNMVRDYNLALKHLDTIATDESEQTGNSDTNSNSSLSVSEKSGTSSIFSTKDTSQYREAELDLQALVFEDCITDEENLCDEVIIMGKNKSLIKIYDNINRKKIEDQLILDTTEFGNIITQKTFDTSYKRSNLEF
ncbi:hypothetical protein AO441_000896 [Nakaseomyces glabratus]|uniref:Uncharacterized protein n=1 Tax=Candida glabrata TaxID=5478 RepID=A0A0W0CW21_CANGB|nr:hypothetical protein AO440_000997 [Nakaseomyces glabratus]KTB03794.1 hypothetical protein AO439_001089 [Nakaseomyces glabratus]KTB06236.1 hypothetical protein AO441_000896 [Nakaseomyces glabratus]KTB22070.1 hypothetical protein AO438_001101 [Nakaseomyces glabratus]